MNSSIDAAIRWPYLTEHLEGIGGDIKRHKEDFFVEELPHYHPCGEGTHVYAFIEKKGLSTMDAVVKIGRALHVPHQQIGYAGLKDTHAVTRQWVSVEHVDPSVVAGMQIKNVRVLEISRHGNKLRTGHLKGNRFVIKIRNLDLSRITDYEQAQQRVDEIMEILVQRGVPNYYGPQRFGNRYDSHLLGGAIINRNVDQFIDMLLGLPDSTLDGSVEFVARSFYEQGQFEKAYDAWPKSYHSHRRALRCLVNARERQREDPKRIAFNRIDKNMKRLYVFAFQSDLFNQVLARRMPEIDVIWDGDLAWKHDSGACFLVEDAQVEQVRCDRFEISPSGPLFGSRMSEPTDRPGEIEQGALAQTGLGPDDFKAENGARIRGARRPLRFQPRDVTSSYDEDDHGSYLELRFELPSGCYATTLLREIIKSA